MNSDVITETVPWFSFFRMISVFVDEVTIVQTQELLPLCWHTGIIRYSLAVTCTGKARYDDAEISPLTKAVTLTEWEDLIMKTGNDMLLHVFPNCLLKLKCSTARVCIMKEDDRFLVLVWPQTVVVTFVSPTGVSNKYAFVLVRSRFLKNAITNSSPVWLCVVAA